VGRPGYPPKQRARPLLLCLADGRGPHVSHVAFLVPEPESSSTSIRARTNTRDSWDLLTISVRVRPI
jgi:hypothetical protein